MDKEAIVAVISSVIKVAVDVGPGLIKTVEEARPFAEQIVSLFSGEHVTQDKLDALLTSANSISADLQSVKTEDQSGGETQG